MLLACVLALPTRALADDPKAEAKQHVDRATELHTDGKLAESLAELKTAYALDPQPQLLFAMGQVHVQLGECAQAISYYERFLSTKPAAAIADVTNEAIDACKTNPPPAIDQPKPEPVTPPQPSDPRPAAAPPIHLAATRTTTEPWYSDRVGVGLVAGGVVSGVVGILLWHSARGDRDVADTTGNYETFASLLDSAHTKQTESIVFGIASAVLVTVGGVHLVLHRGAHDVVVVPAAGGGAITWTGRF
jgi:hypothetical protein